MTDATIEPWCTFGGYRIARTHWWYDMGRLSAGGFSTGEGWVQAYSFLSPTVYPTREACEAAIAALSAPVAALYVETGGVYYGLAGVEPWDEARDARFYPGPHPVVAHPPCKRWGRFWHGSTRKPHQYELGDDGGCFAAALSAVRHFGGVLEHPADSRAWKWFGLVAPPRAGGWIEADGIGGLTCCVDQGHYGHAARKRTWLYYVGAARPPELTWGPCDQRIPQWMIDRYGYAKARKIGVVAMVGGKAKETIRNRTPLPFRDLLLSIARGARRADAAPR